MKLLLDQNLSPRLLQELSVLYAGSMHVRDVGLVIWIRRGNSSTDDIWGFLRVHQPAILAFNEDHEAAFLALG